MEAIPFILFILVWILLYKYLVNKKQKGKLISHLMSFVVATVVMLLSIIPIAPKPIQKQEEIKVLSVSDYSYTLKNEPAVSISYGKDNTNYIGITIHKKNLIEGFSIDTEINSDDKKFVSATAQWDGKTYFDNKNSYIKLEIISLNQSDKKATINIELKLNTVDEEPQIFKNKTQLSIENILFENLVKKIN